MHHVGSGSNKGIQSCGYQGTYCQPTVAFKEVQKVSRNGTLGERDNMVFSTPPCSIYA